jgi:hypothetical protein
MFLGFGKSVLKLDTVAFYTPASFLNHHSWSISQFMKLRRFLLKYDYAKIQASLFVYDLKLQRLVYAVI